MKLKLTHLRVIVQIISFVFLTQLFTLGFLGFNKVLVALLGKSSFKWSSPPVITALLLTVGTVLLGRFFCGWFCAFGTLNDFLHGIFSALTKKRFIIPHKLDSYLVKLKYIILVFIVVFLWTLNLELLRGFSPWNAFATLLKAPFDLPGQSFAFTILIAVLAAGIIYERFFCRYLCPLGAVQALISHVRLTNFYRKEAACNNCSRCGRVCPMGIELQNMGKAKSTECISCYKCIDTCHTGSISTKVLGKVLPCFITAIIGVALFFSSSFIFPAWMDNDYSTFAYLDEEEGEYENKLYKDGTYVGRGIGYHPGIMVQVTFKRDKIVDIKIIKHMETKGYYEEAFDSIPKQILATQSTDYTITGKIDIVSGATATSIGICNGVDKAAWQAAEALAKEKAKADKQKSKTGKQK